VHRQHENGQIAETKQKAHRNGTEWQQDLPHKNGQIQATQQENTRDGCIRYNQIPSRQMAGRETESSFH
jgi:hypothetical protein